MVSKQLFYTTSGSNGGLPAGTRTLDFSTVNPAARAPSWRILFALYMNFTRTLHALNTRVFSTIHELYMNFTRLFTWTFYVLYTQTLHELYMNFTRTSKECFPSFIWTLHELYAVFYMNFTCTLRARTLHELYMNFTSTHFTWTLHGPCKLNWNLLWRRRASNTRPMRY